MTWTLYIQMKKGIPIEKPKAIWGITLSSDTASRRLYAFQGMWNKGELFYPESNFARDGIQITGIEKQVTSRGEVYYYQRWWVSPTKEE